MNVDVFYLEMKEHYEVSKYISNIYSVFANNIHTDFQMRSTNYALTCSNEWSPLALPKHTISSKMAFFSSFMITQNIQHMLLCKEFTYRKHWFRFLLFRCFAWNLPHSYTDHYSILQCPSSGPRRASLQDQEQQFQLDKTAKVQSEKLASVKYRWNQFWLF